MARPAIVQLLKHGRLICRAVFPFFVDTWNWLVGYVDNLKGDADVNPNVGSIKVDRTDPDRPVIRFVGNLAEGGGVPEPPSEEYVWRQVDVVTGSTYDAEAHTFVNHVKSVWVLAPAESTDDTVFTAVPHLPHD